MKKRIFTFLTLLVAFFGLIGLTTNNYKVINAADSITTIDSDLASITVPETAIISFPVPYESVHGNKINWTVSPVILEADASLMLVIQCLSDHKLLNKCAAGKL